MDADGRADLWMERGVTDVPAAAHGSHEDLLNDALFWHPRTEALRPLHHEYQPGEPELETEPTGFQP